MGAIITAPFRYCSLVCGYFSCEAMIAHDFLSLPVFAKNKTCPVCRDAEVGFLVLPLKQCIAAWNFLSVAMKLLVSHPNV
jgi:hypothetical protein